MTLCPIESEESTCASNNDWKGAHRDANIAGNLFRMEGAILGQDAVIRPLWTEEGEFIGEERWSYGELQALARKCCAWLHVRGVRPGQKGLIVRRAMDCAFRWLSPDVSDPGRGASAPAGAVWACAVWA